MPSLASMSDQTKLHILKRALDIAGSREDLARLMRAKPQQLATWLGQAANIPDEMLLRAVDIIQERSR